MTKHKSFGFWIGLLTIVCGTSILWISNGFSQAPPSRLTMQETAPRANPLRADQPIAVPGVIKQTSAQSEDIQFPPMSNWDDFPAPSVQSAPFEGIDPFAAPEPIAATPAPATQSPALSTTSPTLSTASPAPPVASPLSNADPFAMQQSVATVPSQALPITQHPETQRLSSGTESRVGFGDFEDQQRTAALNRSMPMQRTPSEGTGIPGTSILEGPQTPHLTLQKIMPEEVVIDQPATLKTVIQNVGRSTAKNVTITDRVPQGTRLVSTVPQADELPNGELRWSVGNLDPTVQLVVEMRVIPVREGDIGSVASVNYTGEVSGRVTVTRPILKVEVSAPAEVKIGEIANVEITVSNPGTATITNVVLENSVPEGLFHSVGRVIRNTDITVLRPRESKKLALQLRCIGAGNLINHVVVTADGNLMVEEKTTIRALAPALELEIIGARSRFLERRSDYRLIVANKGNTAAHNVALELTLPRAVQFVSTNQSGLYDAATHTVRWALEELPAQEAGEIELVVLPIQKGEHSLRFTGVGGNNLKAEAVMPMTIDGLPAITFEIVGDSNLVEIGKEVTYEIRVANRGTKAAENVKVRVAFADGMSFSRADGARFQANAGVVLFEPLPLLAAKEETVYRLTARSQLDGEHRINVQVISDDLRSPITKEESTKVFR